MPRWGLRDLPSRQEAAPPRTRWAALTDHLTGVLLATAALFGLSALAELGRYLMLLHSRTQLTSSIVLLISDLAVLLTAGLALLSALLAALAATGWLIRRRRAAYAALGQSDSRPVWVVLVGCLLPVVNLLWAGVYLTELARLPGGPSTNGRLRGTRPRGRRRDPTSGAAADERVVRAVRIWWGLWVLNGVMAAAALWWHTATTTQARANGVLFAFYTDLVAAAVALASLWLVRVFGDRDVWGRARLLHRWVPVSLSVVRSEQEEVVAQ